jgi:hypothetical protein
MSYTLRDAASGRLLSCMQLNGYQLPYYGIVIWDEKPDAAAIEEAIRRAGENGPAENWMPVELTGHQAKMANVKLKNDVRRRVFLNNNVLTSTLESP